MKSRSDSTLLGQAIYSIRCRLGETLSQFSERLGCTQGIISKYERGTIKPSRSMLLLMFPLAQTEEEVATFIRELGRVPSGSTPQLKWVIRQDRLQRFFAVLLRSYVPLGRLEKALAEAHGYVGQPGSRLDSIARQFAATFSDPEEQ